jgi:RNA 3'-terminal phosphate cyclase
VLSGKQVVVKDIRAEDENPGLLDHEIDLLKLI